MTLLNKILIIGGAVLTLGLLTFIIYKQNEITNRQNAIESQMVAQKELVNNVLRSQNSYATKQDIEQLLKDNNINLQAIKDDLEKLHAEITAVNTITVNSNGQHGNGLPSTGTGTTNSNPTTPTCSDGTPCPDADPFGYQKKEQLLSLYEDFNGLQVPFGTTGFSAWKKDPWSVDIFPREYHITNVIGLDENQRAYFYNKFTVKVADKNYEVKITNAETKQEFPESSWSWWNPRLFAGMDASVGTSSFKGEFTPSASIALMSLGRFKNQPDLSVLQVGVGYGTVSRKAQLVVTPFAYNIGRNIPLIKNTYIGPTVAVGSDGGIFVGAGIRVGL